MKEREIENTGESRRKRRGRKFWRARREEGGMKRGGEGVEREVDKTTP